MNKKIIFITLILLFFVSFLRAAPLVYKGYAPSGLHADLLLAKNLAEQDVYKLENEKNVVLSSTRVADEGIETDTGNKLTIFLESLLIRAFGFNQNSPFNFSIFLYAISGILIFLIILGLFNNYWLALSAFLVDLFLPFVWKGALFAGSYEFASVFFLLGLLVFLWKEFGSSLEKPASFYARIILSSLLFSLAVLARNAFLLSVVPLGIYEIYKNRSWKSSLCFFVPIIVIFVMFGGVNNSYLKSSDDSFTRYGHLYPDSYTYHFEKDTYLENLGGEVDPDQTEYLLRYEKGVSFVSKIKMYINSAVFYPKQAFSIIIFGGPFFLFLFLFGLISLSKEKRWLFEMFVIWLVLWYGGLVFLKTNNWDHFLEIRIILVLGIALGAWKLVELFKKNSEKKLLTKIFGIGLILLLSMQLFISNRWLFHQDYEASFLPEMVQIVENTNWDEVSDSDIIAVGYNQNAPLMLNYYVDKNFVYFDPATIEKLLGEGTLQSVFAEYGVTKIMGYDENLTAQIVANTND